MKGEKKSDKMKQNKRSQRKKINTSQAEGFHGNIFLFMILSLFI